MLINNKNNIMVTKLIKIISYLGLGMVKKYGLDPVPVNSVLNIDWAEFKFFTL